MVKKRLQRRKLESLSNNPSKEEEHHCSLFKRLLCYPFYAILSIVLIHFYFNPFSFSSPIINYQIPSSNTITTSSPPPPTPPQEVSRKPNATKTLCDYNQGGCVPNTNKNTNTTSSQPPPTIPKEVLRKPNTTKKTSCDHSRGEWVPHNEEPLYNGTTCDTIKKGQNCMAYGRPDKEYLRWKWRPENCNLPRFDPQTFLKLLENKHIAFVGDSLARNQLESLLCMTARAAKPILTYADGEEKKFRKWAIPSHNINISIYWSPFLVKGMEKSAGVNQNTLFLDSPNEIWAADLGGIDVLVFSGGHWFLHHAVYYHNNTVLGCHSCENYTNIEIFEVYGRALTTAFQTIIERKRDKERETNVFLTTFTPSHFVGEWDDIGACNKTAPFRRDEGILEGMNYEMRRVGVERVEEAKVRAREFGDVKVRFEVLDVTRMALMRPDGHPGPYMNQFPFANGVGKRVQNDCVHWCLPGPIDAWNEILLDLMMRWND